jgi:hypothetical protein
MMEFVSFFHSLNVLGCSYANSAMAWADCTTEYPGVISSLDITTNFVSLNLLIYNINWFFVFIYLIFNLFNMELIKIMYYFQSNISLLLKTHSFHHKL